MPVVRQFSKPQEIILTALCYAEVFQFPLRLEEFSAYMPLEVVAPKELELCLHQLVASGVLAHQNGLFAFSNRSDLFEKRGSQRQHFHEKWEKIRQFLPGLLAHRWIKGVLLTGSMAAKNPDGKADADLLLILDSKRMWLGYLWIRLWCRFRKQGLFCPNYVIGDCDLKLNFPNYPTAIEYAMSVPLKWHRVWQDMERENTWLTEVLPNSKPFQARREDLEVKASVFSKIVDGLIGSPFGAVLNACERLRLTLKTKGLYMPSPWVYKPHAPTRQIHILKRLLTNMDACQIAFSEFRQQIGAQLAYLERAEKKWVAKFKPLETTREETRLAKTCGSKIP